MHNTKEMFQRKKNGRGISKIGDEPLLLPEKRISLAKRKSMKESLTLQEGKEILTTSKRLREQADQRSQVATNSNKFKVVYGDRG